MLVALMGHLSSSVKAGHAALKDTAGWVRILVENRLEFSASRDRTEVGG